MTMMGKVLLVVLGLGAVFGVTLALRTEREAPVAHAQLTPAQMAEVQPAPAPAEPPKASPAPAADPAGGPPAPPDLDLEDGSGS